MSPSVDATLGRQQRDPDTPKPARGSRGSGPAAAPSTRPSKRRRSFTARSGQAQRLASGGGVPAQSDFASPCRAVAGGSAGSGEPVRSAGGRKPRTPREGLQAGDPPSAQAPGLWLRVIAKGSTFAPSRRGRSRGCSAVPPCGRGPVRVPRLPTRILLAEQGPSDRQWSTVPAHLPAVGQHVDTFRLYRHV